MKIILGPVAGAMLLAAAPAVAQPQTAPAVTPAPAAAAKPAALDPASIAIAQQILEIAFPPAKRSQMYASVMDSIVDQSRKAMEAQGGSGDKELDAVVDRSVGRMYNEMETTLSASIPDVFASFARAYARDFSRDDLEAILAFVKTPAGQRYFERSPQLIKDPDVQAAMQRSMAQLAKMLPEIQKETMRDVEDYVAQKAKAKKADTASPVS
jgi:hypothetical protein